MNPEYADDKQFAELMRAAQAGNVQAYAQLLKALAPHLQRYVRSQRSFLGQADIEDLMQDIMLSMHAVRATYDSERPFMPWLLAIARHRLADAARRYSRHAAKEVQVEDMAVTFSDETANVAQEEFRDPELLRRAIQALPPGQRTAIEMLKVQEMSLKEASAKTGMTISALKVAVHRGMAALRKTLRSEERS